MQLFYYPFLLDYINVKHIVNKDEKRKINKITFNFILMSVSSVRIHVCIQLLTMPVFF